MTTPSILEALMQAIKARDNEKAIALLSEYPEISAQKDDQGSSPVLIAQYYGAKAIVSALLERGVTLSLFEAAAVGREDTVIRLLDESPPAHLNSYSHDGYTPLGLAAFFGHESVVSRLLVRGADVSAASHNSMSVTPLHSAAAGRHAAIAQMLLEHGADANARQQSGWTPLHSAVHNRHVELVELLLAHGADPHAANDAGVTPLAMAQELGDELLQKLFAR